MLNIASAEVDNTTHWPVVVTKDWNAVYGRVTGLELEDGDSVGMFDTRGNCYGTGLVRGGYYFLSAFKWEEADPNIPGDFEIPGFKEGDTVIFKAYKKSTGEEYILVPASGESYSYVYQGNYPPMRIDLLYKETYASPPSQSSEPSSERETASSQENLTSTAVYPGTLSGLAEAEKTEQTELDKTTEPQKGVAEGVVKDKRATSIKEDMREPSLEETYPEEEMDYEGKEEPSTLTEPLRRTIQPTRDASSKHPSRYTSSHKEEAKETVATEETVLAKAAYSKSKAISARGGPAFGGEKEAGEKEPARKSSPLFVMIILICGFTVLVTALVKRLNR